ncbi:MULTISPECIES: competence type IV pilus minor pilin ComGF [unclassified Bacillus (in: firmicutes)]|uniref:competence type IV pilus minor pilin ComGF n=1 Tax=unclassified Bacillus (in: firmicutes) TaxID=185979 RepID=UPI001587C585|nr:MULTISPECIES: competence type IV pilus minor pilin ComGF [unclassified Bacillus (in: firmicutes)]
MIKTKIQYVNHLNRKGFTLLEILVSLSLLCTTAFFLPPLFSILLKNDYSESRLQEMEWDVFCNQAKKEVRRSTKLEVAGGKLMLTSDVGSVIYEQYGTKLRRRVNLTGHEILLQNINSATFTLLKDGIQISVILSNGDERVSKMYSMVKGVTPQP